MRVYLRVCLGSVPDRLTAQRIDFLVASSSVPGLFVVDEAQRISRLELFNSVARVLLNLLGSHQLIKLGCTEMRARKV